MVQKGDLYKQPNMTAKIKMSPLTDEDNSSFSASVIAVNPKIVPPAATSHFSASSASSSAKPLRTRYTKKEEGNWLWAKVSAILSVRYLLKLIWLELIFYLIIYYAINMCYRYVMDSAQQLQFEQVVRYFDANLNAFGRDLTFLLGFYVSIVAKRWWDQYVLLPWPDNLAINLSGLVTTDDSVSDHLRETIVRYALLSYVLCIRRFSENLKKFLPTVQSIEDLGLVKAEEVRKLNINDFSEHHKQLLVSNWWLPLAWAANLVKFGKMKGQIPGDSKEVLREIMRFRNALENVESHVYVSIPLVYKVVVNVAVYFYFVLTLIGSQLLLPGSERKDLSLEDKELLPDIDFYFPLFVIFKFMLFLGWLKVAHSIEKPFGEDDSDFEMRSLFKRHLRTTRIILDEFDALPPTTAELYPEMDAAKKEKKVKGPPMVVRRLTVSSVELHNELLEKEKELEREQNHLWDNRVFPQHRSRKDTFGSTERLSTAQVQKVLPDNSEEHVRGLSSLIRRQRSTTASPSPTKSKDLMDEIERMANPARKDVASGRSRRRRQKARNRVQNKDGSSTDVSV